MEYKDVQNYLGKQDIAYQVLNKTTSEMERIWEELFVPMLSTEDKKSIHLYDVEDITGNLWHCFSYNKTPHFKAKKARNEYDKQTNNGRILFFKCYEEDIVIYIPKGEFLSRSHLKTIRNSFPFIDVYVLDENYEWTYVITHEDSLGPYFSYTYLGRSDS